MKEILQEYGMAYLWSDGYEFSGLLVTLWLLILSLFIGFMLSLPLAVARASRVRWLSRTVWVFTWIIRGTPLYIQLLIVYTGIYSFSFVREIHFLNDFFRNGFYCVVLTLGINTTAFTTELFSGAIKGICWGEVEAARAYGLSGFKLYHKIILPAALRRALPLYSNEVILMLHATSIAFTATVSDILKVAGDVNATTYQSFQAYGIAALIYLLTTCVFIGLFRQGEKRWLAFTRPRGR